MEKVVRASARCDLGLVIRKRRRACARGRRPTRGNRRIRVVQGMITKQRSPAVARRRAHQPYQGAG